VGEGEHRQRLLELRLEARVDELDPGDTLERQRPQTVLGEDREAAGEAASSSTISPRSRERSLPIDGWSVRSTANVPSVLVTGSREA
jgi:hypothetical protein